MEKSAIINGTEYYIDTNPKYRYLPVIYRVVRTLATDPVAKAFQAATGKPVMVPTKFEIEFDERCSVVVALGRKFSNSKMWQREFDFDSDFIWKKERELI
jgi:hypothetical protein